MGDWYYYCSSVEHSELLEIEDVEEIDKKEFLNHMNNPYGKFKAKHTKKPKIQPPPEDEEPEPEEEPESEDEETEEEEESEEEEETEEDEDEEESEDEDEDPYTEDDLKGLTRSELDEIAEELGLDPDDYRNKTQIKEAILEA